jgi:uncharacterized membrane protein
MIPAGSFFKNKFYKIFIYLFIYATGLEVGGHFILKKIFKKFVTREVLLIPKHNTTP